MNVASFHYRAVSASGDIVEGSMDAVSPDTVVERLRQDGHFPLSVGEAIAGGKASSRYSRASRVRAPKLGALASLTQELSTLLRAGLPVDRALEFVAETTPDHSLRRTVTDVLGRVRNGATLADAVTEAGAAFPVYYPGMLRAGETGGNLHSVLEDLSAYLDRLHSFRESLRSALIYPAILGVMTLLTVIVMFAGVLPQFRPLFEDMGDDLPLLTRAFLAAGDFVEAWWWAGAIGLAAIFLFVRIRLRSPAFRLSWDRMKLGVPFVGNIVQRAETVRFSRTLSMLLAGGVPVTEALRTVRDALANAVFRRSVESLVNSLREGGSLGDGVASAGIFPLLAVQLIRVGEAGGRLDGVLNQLAESLEREIQRDTQRLLAFLVPGVTIFLGGIVALVIISVLGAFLSVNDLAY